MAMDVLRSYLRTAAVVTDAARQGAQQVAHAVLGSATGQRAGDAGAGAELERLRSRVARLERRLEEVESAGGGRADGPPTPADMPPTSTPPVVPTEPDAPGPVKKAPAKRTAAKKSAANKAAARKSPAAKGPATKAPAARTRKAPPREATGGDPTGIADRINATAERGTDPE